MFKQENIANIENVDLYKDFDFSEEIDEDSVCKELDGVWKYYPVGQQVRWAKAKFELCQQSSP